MMNKVKSICIYYANMFLWLFLKAFSIKKNAKRYNAILIIPPDSWTVWGSRGDEAMLEVVIDNYKKKGMYLPHIPFFSFSLNLLLHVDKMFLAVVKFVLQESHFL